MAEDRLTTICEQAPPVVTGIDFVEVVQPHVQLLLRVYFIVDPDTLTVPMVATAAMPLAVDPAIVTIASASGGARVRVTGATWRVVATPAGNRTVLEVAVAAPGDFSLYRLTIEDAPADRVDRFFNGVVFSFKQGCPSVFDCRRARECPPDEPVDWPVDYLARDFESFRNALLDFAAQRYPLWRERIPADQAVMLMELAAALGDELSYVQDRIAREAALDTMAERRSLRRATQLVDFTLDDGRSATTWLALTVRAAMQARAPVGAIVWAVPEGEPPIPFEVGRSLADRHVNVAAPITEDDLWLSQQLWVSAAWNDIPVYTPDAARPCLEAGATELWLVGAFPLAAQLPVGANAARFWLGRAVVIRLDPLDPSLRARRHLVHLTEVETAVDPIAPGGPLQITRIAWSADEALPFDLCLDDASVCANALPAIAGETFEEGFAIRDKQNVPPLDRPDTPLAVERQGPLNEIELTRPPIFLHSLSRTEERGLGWLPKGPEVELEELAPAGGAWEWRATLIDALGEDRRFTLDDGTWRAVIGFDRPDGRFEHRDRASGAGMTIRFGDGAFGAIPPDGAHFRARYRTDVGTRANLPAESVRSLENPDPALPPSPLLALATRVTNPFPVTDGRDPQDLATAKQLAPEAFKAEPRRAVRDEDYRAIAERLPWVQRAGATARWTGSWLTEFVSVDPRDSLELSPARRAELEREMDCVRQAGRPVVVREPVYLPVDLRIVICVAPHAYEGQVLEAVTAALTAPKRPGRPPAFFHPDNFTFGTPLYRAALEAAIQAVPGVLAVIDVQIRVRGVFDWQSFDPFVFRPGDDRILRVDNDPNHPESGSLLVTTRSLSP